MIAAEVLEGLFATAAARLDENLKLDHIPYTQNQHYFVSTRDAVLAELRSARAKKNGGAKIVRSSTEPDTVSTALAGLSAMGFYGLKEDDLKKLLAADPYETELEAAADRGVLAGTYVFLVSPCATDRLASQVAYKRRCPFLADPVRYCRSAPSTTSL